MAFFNKEILERIDKPTVVRRATRRRAMAAARAAATAFLARVAGPRASNARRSIRNAAWSRRSSVSAAVGDDDSASPVRLDHADDVLGEERTGEGVVTRRHTLGKSLTFIDVTCQGVGPGEPSGSGGDEGDPSDSSSHFVFIKAFGNIGKAVRIGATIRFTGRELTPIRPRERDSIALRPGSYSISVPPNGVSLLKATPASQIANARPWDPAAKRVDDTTVPRGGGPISVDATGRAPVAQLCKSLVAVGRCGDPNCVRRHDISDTELREVRNAREESRARSAAAVAREFDPDDPHAHETKASKQDSDRIFADWIVRTFGLVGAGDAEVAATKAAAGDLGRTRRDGDVNARGGDEEDRDVDGGDGDVYGGEGTSSASTSIQPRRHRVADIAGGGGVLSFELHVRHGLGATLCDPAAVSVSARQMNTWKNLRKKASRAGVGSPEYRAWQRAESWVNVARAEETRRRREHVRRVLRYADDDAGMDVDAVSSDEVTSTRVASGASGDDDAIFEHFAAEFWGDTAGPVGSAVGGCDVLVGMHPDQATEPIVDAAIELGKPFAVVPCCVFPELFPERRTKDGDSVRTYVQFLDYLVAKHPDIKLAYLPFKGRNRVVYRL